MVGECVSDLFNDNEILTQVASECKFTESPAAESEDNLSFSDVDFVHMPKTRANCTLVWQDLKTLYITAISSVYRIVCNQPGFLSYPRIQ